MMKINFRLLIFILATIFGVIFSIPSILQTEGGKKINLGLDLQGGLHLLLGVKGEEAVKSRIKSIATGFNYFAEQNDILIEELKKQKKPLDIF